MDARLVNHSVMIIDGVGLWPVAGLRGGQLDMLRKKIKDNEHQ